MRTSVIEDILQNKDFCPNRVADLLVDDHVVASPSYYTGDLIDAILDCYEMSEELQEMPEQNR